MTTRKLQKTTEESSRAYDDACGLVLGTELIGERWTLIILRELMYGPRRFGQIRNSIPGITASVLTQRLERLETARALIRRKLPPPAAVLVYELTEWGRRSEAMMEAVANWAVQSPRHNPKGGLSDTSLMMSFRSMLVPTRAKGLKAKIVFAIGEEHFTADIHDGTIEIARGEAAEADLRLTTDSAKSIASATYGGMALRDLEATGALRINGDRELAERFVTLFAVPRRID